MDDFTLLRAIKAIDGEEIPTASLSAYLISKPEFQVVIENDHLRSLLRKFLESNIEVKASKEALEKASSGGKLLKWLKTPLIKEIKSQLQSDIASQEVAFKAYEMLRRLTCYDNSLLERRKY